MVRTCWTKLSEIVGQPVIVENRPGSAGQLAVTYVQSQPADGYTIIVGAIGQLAIATPNYPNLPFHPTRTLVPLTLLGSYWLAIAVPRSTASPRWRISSRSPRPTRPSRTIRLPRRPSRSRPSCSSCGPACPGRSFPTRAPTR